MDTVTWNSVRVIGWIFRRLINIVPFAPWSRVYGSQTEIRQQVIQRAFLNQSQGFHKESELFSAATVILLHLMRVPLVDVLPEVRFAIGITSLNTLDDNSHPGQYRVGWNKNEIENAQCLNWLMDDMK
jgi:hypothetical protein